MTLCLIRHGETEENLKRILQGHLPGSLSDTGKKQAAELKDKLCLNDFDSIVSSDLKRATDTVMTEEPIFPGYSKLCSEKSTGEA